MKLFGFLHDSERGQTLLEFQGVLLFMATLSILALAFFDLSLWFYYEKLVSALEAAFELP